MIHSPQTIIAALAADSLNLGPHWIYNQSKLTRSFPDGIHELTAPLTNYHPNKKSGDLTHYGDNIALILRTHALTDSWDHDLYTRTWKSYWSNTQSFIDQATKTTLTHLEDQSSPASTANDLAGAAQALCITAFTDLSSDISTTIADVRQHTAFTHNDPETIDAAEFFTHALAHLQSEKNIPNALNHAAQQKYTTLKPAEYIAAAQQELQKENHLKTAADFGLTCHTPEAFPLTIYYLLRNPEKIAQALSENALAGGDNAARGIIIAILLTAANPNAQSLSTHWQNLTKFNTLNPLLTPTKPTITPIKFENQTGNTLQATLHTPPSPRAFAIFAHCFTCGQSSRAASQISTALSALGIATLRFDFTGLGKSQGDFADTSFLTNTADLISAAQYLTDNHAAPTLLIGHSLGGAAVLAAAHAIPSVKAIATIGAPAEPAHIEHLISDYIDEINTNGSAKVKLAGNEYTIGKKFLQDIQNHNQKEHIANLKADLLVLHSPTDQTVGIENAGDIYTAAKHPKSFIALTNADHLLLSPGATSQAAKLIAAWADRSL